MDINFLIGFQCLSFQHHLRNPIFFWSIESCLLFAEAFVMGRSVKREES